MIVTQKSHKSPRECIPPHLWIWPNRFDNRRIVKYVYAYFTLNFTGGVFLIALSSQIWYVLWREYHGSARKTFPGIVFAFCAVDSVVRYQTTSEMCLCIIGWHFNRWCHCNRFFSYYCVLKEQYDGPGVGWVRYDNMCEQPQSYPFTR
jgi:hypothetical protein